IGPDGFDPETGEWKPGFDDQRLEWERQYNEALAKWEAVKAAKTVQSDS
ncbi:MAG: hypothetical protein RL587_288, partial [Actinomycetota bacterium]